MDKALSEVSRYDQIVVRLEQHEGDIGELWAEVKRLPFSVAVVLAEVQDNKFDGQAGPKPTVPYLDSLIKDVAPVYQQACGRSTNAHFDSYKKIRTSPFTRFMVSLVDALPLDMRIDEAAIGERIHAVRKAYKNRV